MRHEVDDELAGWFKSRNMQVPTSVEIPESSRDLFVRHLNQSKQFRAFSERSRMNWAIWTTLTHVGHDEARSPLAGTMEPLKVVAQQKEVMPPETTESSVGPVTDAGLNIPLTAPVTVEHHTVEHVSLTPRDWLTVALTAALADGVLHGIVLLMEILGAH